MEKVKCVVNLFEILFGIFILYRSGRIVSNKGKNGIREKFFDDDIVLLLATYMGFLSIILLRFYNSTHYIMFYASMGYIFICFFCRIKSNTLQKIIVGTIGLIDIVAFLLLDSV